MDKCLTTSGCFQNGKQENDFERGVERQIMKYGTAYIRKTPTGNVLVDPATLIDN